MYVGKEAIVTAAAVINDDSHTNCAPQIESYAVPLNLLFIC